MAAVSADGTVEVLIEKGSRTEAYQAEYGFRCGKRYAIDGCYGDYQKLLVASVGPNYCPVLFLLTDSGTVEYLRLFAAFRFGKPVSRGPLYGVGVPEGFWGDPPKVVDLEAGAGISVSYTGYLGMNETGLLYGYTVTGPDGNDLVGTMALLPQDGTMMAAPAGGDALLVAPDGLQFVKN